MAANAASVIRLVFELVFVLVQCPGVAAKAMRTPMLISRDHLLKHGFTFRSCVGERLCLRQIVNPGLFFALFPRVLVRTRLAMLNIDSSGNKTEKNPRDVGLGLSKQEFHRCLFAVSCSASPLF